MRKLVLLLAIAACGGGGSDNPRDSGIDGPPPDGPAITPVLTSFTASPSTVTAGVPTMVTWNWSYQNQFTFPDPTCSIDNGVGAVMRGQSTEVTLTTVTTFTLTCVNPGGMAQRQVVVAVPPVAPNIATFTATPANLTVGAATSVSWNWTYANTPTPTPTCTIEHGVGTVTPGGATSVTQTGTRIYRITCSNSAGRDTADVTIGVDECAAGMHQCGPNSTCVNTTESYACQCNANFVQPPSRTTCAALVACPGTPCDPNATCTSTGAGTACVCNTGYIGDGTTCARQRVAFITAVSGSGDLSTWSDALGQDGLLGADNVCQQRANAAGLTTANGYGPFRAWMSDSTTDAYCRMHNLTGTKANNCNQVNLPAAAGPWVSLNGVPFAPRIDKLVAPSRQLFGPLRTTDTGGTASATATILTGTDDAGVRIANSTCSDWTTNSSVVTGTRGEAGGGGGGTWTDALAADPSCSNFGQLRCMEVVDATAQGAPLDPPLTGGRRIFVTSVMGNGQLSSWPDANGSTGLTAADEICRARARFAGYTSAQAFEAYIASSSSSLDPNSRIFTFTGPWLRPDGTPVASTRSDLFNGQLMSPVSQTEDGTFLAGRVDTGGVWTGTDFGSATFNSCSSWTSSSSSGTVGRHDLTDNRWSEATNPSTIATCSTMQRLYCLQD